MHFTATYTKKQVLRIVAVTYDWDITWICVCYCIISILLECWIVRILSCSDSTEFFYATINGSSSEKPCIIGCDSSSEKHTSCETRLKVILKTSVEVNTLSNNFAPIWPWYKQHSQPFLNIRNPTISYYNTRGSNILQSLDLPQLWELHRGAHHI